MNKNIFIALGANIGDPLTNFLEARTLLAQDTTVIQSSSCYKTKPYGPKDQPDFLNAVVQVQTSLSSEALFEKMQTIETVLGKNKTRVNGPRAIDLDLLFYGNEHIMSNNITVPHPKIAERDFVLLPLTEIAPKFIHPTLNTSMENLLASLNETFFTGDKFNW